MKWLSSQEANGDDKAWHWRSLWVILYDLSVEEYTEMRREQLGITGVLPLPPLDEDIVLMEYANGEGKYETWMDRVRGLLKGRRQQ